MLCSIYPYILNILRNDSKYRKKIVRKFCPYTFDVPTSYWRLIRWFQLCFTFNKSIVSIKMFLLVLIDSINQQNLYIFVQLEIWLTTSEFHLILLIIKICNLGAETWMWLHLNAIALRIINDLISNKLIYIKNTFHFYFPVQY